MTPGFALQWRRREPPLTPAAVVGFGAHAAALAEATRERVTSGARLRAAADADTLVVIGDTADLPWANGARYLGWEAGILVPTTARPWPSAALWRDALAPADGGLVVLLPDAALIMPMPARPVDPALLVPVGEGTA